MIYRGGRVRDLKHPAVEGISGSMRHRSGAPTRVAVSRKYPEVRCRLAEARAAVVFTLQFLIFKGDI
jgi:hypothetical protein